MAGDPLMAFDFVYPTPLPSTKGWGPGYPNCQAGKMRSHPIFKPGVHEDIWLLVTLLAEEIERRGMRLRTPGCWGYACKTGGGSTPSFHSWGLAVDINAPENVWGSDANQSAIATRYRWVVGLMEEYGFFWLGPPIKDWMHFHFAGSPADARRMTEKAKEELWEERMYSDFIAGIEARENGEELGADWNRDKKRGWRLENRVQRAMVEPEPGASGAHDHPHDHPHRHRGGLTSEGVPIT